MIMQTFESRRHREPIGQILFCLFSAAVILASLWFWYRSRSSDELLNQAIQNNLISATGQTDASDTPSDPDAAAPVLIHLRAADELSLAFQYYDKLQESQTPPEGAFPVLSRDLSGKPSDGEILINNQTSYRPDAQSLLALPVSAGTDGLSDPDQPLVLILHTHGTEAYRPEAGLWYTQEQASFRSNDPENNVVAVGEVMQKVFGENGISSIHCTVMHDAESYNDSYRLAAQTIQKYIREYPSIRYVFDVHRDAITGDDNSVIRCVTDADGKPVAQVMLVAGTNEKGADHPNWEQNLALAVRLQTVLNRRYADLARPISLRGASYNQNYTNGSLLIEIGSTGNTLEEAKASAALTAQALSDIIGGEFQ